MNMGDQRRARAIGESGCYYLALLKGAQKHLGARVAFDALSYYEMFTDLGYMQKDCYICKGHEILSALTGIRWCEATKEAPGYSVKPTEISIMRFELKEPLRPLAHFVLGTSPSDIVYDPMSPSSPVVESGQFVSYRIYRRTGG
jgi:hypothetical protein